VPLLLGSPAGWGATLVWQPSGLGADTRWSTARRIRSVASEQAHRRSASNEHQSRSGKKQGRPAGRPAHSLLDGLTCADTVVGVVAIHPSSAPVVSRPHTTRQQPNPRRARQHGVERRERARGDAIVPKSTPYSPARRGEKRERPLGRRRPEIHAVLASTAWREERELLRSRFHGPVQTRAGPFDPTGDFRLLWGTFSLPFRAPTCANSISPGVSPPDASFFFVQTPLQRQHKKTVFRPGRTRGTCRALSLLMRLSGGLITPSNRDTEPSVKALSLFTDPVFAPDSTCQQSTASQLQMQALFWGHCV